MKTKSILICLMLAISCNFIYAQKKYTLKSPDEKISVNVTVGNNQITYSVMHDNTSVIIDSPISMELSDGKILGADPVVRNIKTETVDKLIKAHFYKKEYVEDYYNELTLTFKELLKMHYCTTTSSKELA